MKRERLRSTLLHLHLAAGPEGCLQQRTNHKRPTTLPEAHEKPAASVQMMDKLVAVLALWAIADAAAASDTAPSRDGRHPPISVIHGVLLTTAADNFGDHQGAFTAAAEWHEARLHSLAPDRPAPYLACAAPPHHSNDDGNARVPAQRTPHLQGLLDSGAAGGRVVSSSDEHGVCVLATATPREAERVFLSSEGSSSSDGVPYKWVAFPSALKIAPGLLDHGSNGNGDDGGAVGGGREGQRLATTHGERLHPRKPRSSKSNGNDGRNRSINGDTSGPSPVVGLTVELAPGVLAAAHRSDGGGGGGDWHDGAEDLVREWREELVSSSLNLHEMSYWSAGWADSELAAGGDSDKSTGRAGAGERLAREWTRASDVLRDLGGVDGGPVIGDICSWDELVIFHTDHDVLALRGKVPQKPLG